jgi:hypothetical protein
MSDKTKKFNPPMGWIVSVNHQEVSIRRLAEALHISPYTVGKALEIAVTFLFLTKWIWLLILQK